VAAIGGAPPDLAIRIGAAMTLLQLGIGVTNDVVDAPHDAGRKPGKPIPAGLVSVGAAQVAAFVLFIAGLGVAWSVSLPLAVLAAVVAAIGLAYDLGLKGTAWSWLPFAIGIPILPVFGWVGATGGIHKAFGVLVPAAVAAGAALAIGNALVDVERDRAAGRTSAAARLGPGMASRVAAILLALVLIAALASAAAVGANAPLLLVLLVAGAVPVIAASLAGGQAPSVREIAWRIEAVGLAVLAIAWVRAVLV
jgi:4-hydroxybenzoate polyprenyltransferase